MQIQLPERIQRVNQVIIDAGGQPYLVGGFVRDAVMQQRLSIDVTPNDADLEVHNLSLPALREVLGSLGKVDEVGQSFVCFKLLFEDETIDVALPRREIKTGTGHTDFDVTEDETMGIKDAASRRDFTINSMAADAQGNIVDPFNGIRDIDNRILRATSSRFAEDPLRVLRGMQFTSRFGFAVTSETAALCASLSDEFKTISAERVYGEWQKWARGKYLKLGIEYLDTVEWLRNFPKLVWLMGTPQSPEYHPEGSAFVHTLLALEKVPIVAAVHHIEDQETLAFATLLHDIGKPLTTIRDEDTGKITSYGHAEVGADLARKFLEQMRAPEATVQRVSGLVREHMVHASGKPTKPAVRRLAKRLADDGTSIRMLSAVCAADASGRGTGFYSPMDDWLEIAESLTLTHTGPSPLLMGRHLILAGMQPGPRFGEILRVAFEAQLDGQFSTEAEAIEWFNNKEIV